MGRHKYRKRENEISQNGERFARAEGSGLFDVAKNLTKKAAEAALKKGAVSVGRKLGESAAEKVFRSSARTAVQPGKTLRQSSRVEDLSEARYQSPENSDDEIFKILSSISKAQPKQTSQKYSEEQKTNNQRPKSMRGLTQKEINENLNKLMNM